MALILMILNKVNKHQEEVQEEQVILWVDSHSISNKEDSNFKTAFHLAEVVFLEEVSRAIGLEVFNNRVDSLVEGSTCIFNHICTYYLSNKLKDETCSKGLNLFGKSRWLRFTFYQNNKKIVLDFYCLFVTNFYKD